MESRIPPILRPEHPEPRELAWLLRDKGWESRGELAGVWVSGVTLSTSDLRTGDLFVGVPGAHIHGARFAAKAQEAGALALLTDAKGAALASASGLPIIVVPDPRGVLGEVAAWVYQTAENPAKLFGITGTNGKTSTSYLLKSLLTELGYRAGLSSTAERHIGEEKVVSLLTTPEASELHALLARMREEKVGAVAVEVSAQALSRNRVDGLVFDVAAFTNLSHDHLDDYAGLDEYLRAKLALFTPQHARRGVVSLDTAYGQKFAELAKIPLVTLATRGVASEADTRIATWVTQIIAETPNHTEFLLTGRDGQELKTRVPLIGWHMAANASLAIVLLTEAGVPFVDIAEKLGERGEIRAYLPGRTERVSGERGPNVYVDFGHSPHAFENTLRAVRQITEGKTIMVFGADGDRDASKREDMARVAAEGADILVITDHHPRFENPDAIRQTLLSGARLAKNGAEVYEVSPPEKAIRVAVSLAKEGDAILWAGPGHQDYRDIRGVRTPYSARNEARAALREAGWA